MRSLAPSSIRRAGWILLALGVLWHLATLGSLRAGYLDPLFHDACQDRGEAPSVHHGKGLDFFSIYQAGWNFRHGLSVYFGVGQSRFGPENTVVPYFSGFRYLPWYAYAYGTLLSLVPPWTSYWCWIACVEALLGLCILLTWRLAAGDPLRPLLASLWLLYSPYYLELHIGQQSMVTAALLLLTGIGLVRGRPGLAGWAYGASAVWKLNTLVALPLWIRLGRWRILAGIVLFALATSLPYFLLVPGAWTEFTGYFHHFLLPDGPNAFGLPALLAVLWRRLGLDPAGLGGALRWSGRLLILCGGLATFARRRSDPLRLLALWIASYFLIYKYVWEHHFVLLLPMLVLLVHQERRPWLLVAWLLAALPTPFGLWAAPGEPFPQVGWSTGQELWYHLQKLLAPGAIFFWVVWGELAGAAREGDLWVTAFWRRLRGAEG